MKENMPYNISVRHISVSPWNKKAVAVDIFSKKCCTTATVKIAQYFASINSARRNPNRSKRRQNTDSLDRNSSWSIDTRR